MIILRCRIFNYFTVVEINIICLGLGSVAFPLLGKGLFDPHSPNLLLFICCWEAFGLLAVGFA